MDLQSKSFDYIITGAGCAGLSLVMHMIHSGKFSDKKILIIDKDPKRSNDRTWCFWQRDPGLFEPVVYKKWSRLCISGRHYTNQFAIGPYQYKMIRGIDFYEFCFSVLRRQSNISVCFGEVEGVFSNEKETGVYLNGERILCDYVFNSILFKKPALKENEYWILQHFKGWKIETEQEYFDDDLAGLMDFRTDQKGATAFCYVLPFTSKNALVEYTVFSKNLLEQEEYVAPLQMYIEKTLGIKSYQIVEVESGIIPMTNHRFATSMNNLVNIGTAGGQTKGSSGYTFNFIQKHSRSLVERLIQTGMPFLPPKSQRFQFYDSVFLEILDNNKMPGERMLSDLFRKNDPRKVLQFLDNETSIRDELKLISSLPVIPFTKAALKQIF